MTKRPSAKQLAARRAFAARYGGKRVKRSSSRRVVRVGRRNPAPMARRRSSRRSFRGVSRGVSKNALIDGAMAGAAGSLAAQYVGPMYGPALGFAAVGIWRKNPTAQFIAGASLGANLASSFALPGGTAVGPGGVL